MRTSIKDNWKKTWNSPAQRLRLIIIIVLIPSFILALPLFFNHIETRKGVLLNDWLLANIPALDVSVPIFSCIWGMILLMLYRSLYKPSIFINYCLTLALVTVCRIICLSLVPLSPPVGLIKLTDPLTGIFYGNAVITKDLFFSGHTATLVTIFLCLEKPADKLIGLIAVIAVAVLLLVQHVHYTIDILAAPAAVYGCYFLTCHYIYKQKVKHKVFKAVYSFSD